MLNEIKLKQKSCKIKRINVWKKERKDKLVIKICNKQKSRKIKIEKSGQGKNETEEEVKKEGKELLRKACQRKKRLNREKRKHLKQWRNKEKRKEKKREWNIYSERSVKSGNI